MQKFNIYKDYERIFSFVNRMQSFETIAVTSTYKRVNKRPIGEMARNRPVNHRQINANLPRHKMRGIKGKKDIFFGEIYNRVVRARLIASRPRGCGTKFYCESLRDGLRNILYEFLFTYSDTHKKQFFK